MVVAAGQARGIRLRSPGASIRPTARATRAVLFETLGDVSGCKVLDLYAGSGSLGIEALSRGAACATFVESLPQAVGRLRENLDSIGLAGEVIWDKVENVLALPSAIRYELIFVDPPPSQTAQAVARDLECLVVGGYLADQGRVIVCRPQRDWRLEPLGLQKIWERALQDRHVSAFAHNEEA